VPLVGRGGSRASFPVGPAHGLQAPAVYGMRCFERADDTT